MRKKIIVIFLLTVLPFAYLSASEDSKTTKASNTESYVTLNNPPNSYTFWNFDGNQTVKVTVKNGGVLLGVTATIGCLSESYNDRSFVLAPFQTSPESVYSAFKNVPIAWRFQISTISDAAIIHGHAWWNAYN